MLRRLIMATFGCIFPWAELAAAGTGPERRIFMSGSSYLVIEALTDDMLHFELSASGKPDPTKPLYTTPMVAKADFSGPKSFTANEQSVKTEALSATVELDTLCVIVFDLKQKQQLHKICPEKLQDAWKELRIDSPETRNVYGLGQYFSEETADGDWLGRVWDPLVGSFGAQMRGFAGGANDFSMFPVMYALGDGKKTYGLFLDQIYKQLWDFRGSPWRIGMWGDQIRWFVIRGDDLPSVRRAYLALTGLPPVPPKRSFGLWVSEFGFTNWDEVSASLQSLRANHFPVDGFALDLQWFGGTFGEPDKSRMGSLTFDPAGFPNPAQKIRQFRDEDHVRLMVIEEPFIAKSLPEHAELAERGFLARICETCGPVYLNYNPWWGRGGMVDFTSPEAGDFWHDFRRQKLVDLGIHDHWTDLGEPEQFDAGAWYYGFPELGKHAHADIHNIYGFDWTQSIWRGYQRHKNDARPFLLSRTGTSGIQRFGVGIWSGDIGTNWGNLLSQMHAQMHMSLSGVDYYGSDVGGFQRAQGSIEGGEELLYTQWFAASAMIDVPLRPHAWNLDKQRSTAPSMRGDAKSNLENLKLRYQLAPYYYSLAHLAHQKGDPLFPPLVHYFQSDPKVRQLGSEKMLGPSLITGLVADPKALTRDLYLPSGRWVDFRTHAWVHSEGASLRDWPLYSAGVFRLPLFAKAGAIVPMAEVDGETLNIEGDRKDGSKAEGLHLKVFADAEPSRFELYEDDGETFAYSQGQMAITEISQQLKEKTAEVTVAPTRGSYQGMPTARTYELEFVAEGLVAAEVEINGGSLTSCKESANSSGFGKMGAPCFVAESSGTTRVWLGRLSLQEEKKVLLHLVPSPPPPPSAYIICKGMPEGAEIFAVGSVKQLGEWDTQRAVALAAAAPGFTAAVISHLPESTVIEWKCLAKSKSGKMTWQPGNNSQFKTGASGYAGASVGAF